MSRNVDQEIADMLQELKDLEEAICAAGRAAWSVNQGHSGGENCDTSGSDRGDGAQATAHGC